MYLICDNKLPTNYQRLHEQHFNLLLKADTLGSYKIIYFLLFLEDNQTNFSHALM